MSESESTNLLQNKHTKIEWKAKEDALSIVDLESGLEIMDPSTGRDPATDGLWQIDLENEIIRPSQAKRRKSSVDENMLALTWTDFNFVSAPRFSVTAAVTLASDGFSRWELSFVGAARDWQISGVRYPRLTGLSRLGEQEWLALPYMLGMLVENPHANLKDLRDNTIGTTAVTGAARTKESITSRWQSWYPGQLSMQCSALYGSSGRGFYIAAEDSEAHLKSLAWQHSGENRLDVEFLSYPSLPLSDGRYELPYPVVTGVFKGDWISAAKIYRTWAIKQKWYENSRYRRSLSADWLRETGLWMWNRSYAENIIVPAATLRDFAGVRVSVLWHWWHGCAYDTGFPEYLPPRGGNGKFRDALVSLAREGIQPIVYVNGRLWGTSTQSWQDEGALAGAAQAADGGTYAEVYNTFNRLPCAPMCPQHKVWQNKISALFVEILQDYNLPGIYMDQVAIAEPARCHNPNHGHDLPGGNGWAAGYHDLMAKMREKVDGDRMVATEGCCEVYMDSYDAFLTLDASVERFNAGVASNPYCLPIPFFPAVYHGGVILFGSYASLLKPPYDDLWPQELRPTDAQELVDVEYAAHFRLDWARQFIWGLQPMLANFTPEQLETRPQEMEFVKQLVRLRAAGQKYLLDGEFISPPRASGIPVIHIQVHTRSIYSNVEDRIDNTRMIPAVFFSAWRARDGDIGLVFANVSDEEVVFKLYLDGEKWSQTTPRILRQLGGDGCRQNLESSGDELDLSLGPHAATLLELKG